MNIANGTTVTLTPQSSGSYQGVLFYIIEEAVNNARKHAQAEHIWVRLNIEAKCWRSKSRMTA